MNIVLLACADGADWTVGWLRGCKIGLRLLFEDDIGIARGESEKYLDDVHVASLWHLLAVDGKAVGRGSAFARQRTADLPDILDDMFLVFSLLRYLN